MPDVIKHGIGQSRHRFILSPQSTSSFHSLYILAALEYAEWLSYGGPSFDGYDYDLTMSEIPVYYTILFVYHIIFFTAAADFII